MGTRPNVSALGQVDGLTLGTSRPEGFKVKLSSATLSLVFVVVVGVTVLAPSYFAFFTEGATGYSDRVVRSREEAIGSDLMEPGAMVTFASPYLSILKFYNPNLWPGSDISLASVYMGALIIVLALVAILIRPKSSWRWWLVAIILLSLMCAVGKHLPLRGWLYDYFIPARYFRTAALFQTLCYVLCSDPCASRRQQNVKTTSTIRKRVFGSFLCRQAC